MRKRPNLKLPKFGVHDTDARPLLLGWGLGIEDWWIGQIRIRPIRQSSIPNPHPSRRTWTLNFGKVLVLLLLTACLASAQPKEFFTDAEVDLIRDAQELPMRVSALLRLADIRLTALSLKEKSAKEQEFERKADDQHRKEVKEAQKAGKAAPKAAEKPDVYLADFTRSELLRGYTEAIDEVMTNIDDSFSRKLDVRDALEQFARYSKEQLPLLKTFQPKNNSESSAKDAAIEITEKAIEDTRTALEIVPKTEKSGKKP